MTSHEHGIEALPGRVLRWWARRYRWTCSCGAVGEWERPGHTPGSDAFLLRARYDLEHLIPLQREARGPRTVPDLTDAELERLWELAETDAWLVTEAMEVKRGLPGLLGELDRLRGELETLSAEAEREYEVEHLRAEDRGRSRTREQLASRGRSRQGAARARGGLPAPRAGRDRVYVPARGRRRWELTSSSPPTWLVAGWRRWRWPDVSEYGPGPGTGTFAERYLPDWLLTALVLA